jgi:hypothetical protein
MSWTTQRRFRKTELLAQSLTELSRVTQVAEKIQSV